MSVLFSELYTLDSVTSGDFPTIVINHDTFTRTLQDVSFPDKAGGFTFSDPTDNLANRFILWRSHGDILELQEISLHHNLTNNILKVSFGGSAIVSCHISETHEAVVCLVCTSHGASQLLFTHPRMLPNAANVSIIGNKKNVQYSFHQIKGLQPSVIRCGTAFVLHHSGVSVFAYGLSTGSIMIARVLPFDSTAPEGTEVFELCQTSIIQKLWSGITPFSSKTDNDSASSPLDIISLDLGCDEYFLATICRDHRLRLWDFKHRNCFAVLDLLEFLPRTLDLNASLDQSALHSNFAPGLCHRLSSEVVSSHSINIIVYMSMCLSSTANNMMIGLDFSQSKEVNTSYWCWIHMDIAKALNRNRECLSVLQVDPLIQDSNEGALNTYNNNDSYNTEFLSYESNMNSLLKIQKPDISVLDFIPSEIAKKSGGGNESSERGIKSKMLWVVYGGWRIKLILVILNWILPSWHKLPAYIAIQSASQEQLDSLWDETGIDVQLEIFLDHLFHPGCLSWFAITNAFKSICETYGLLDGDLLLNVSDLHETRVRIHRTLLVNIIPKLSRDDVKAMFKTFYSTAIDYHEHGLQPLGLLRIHKKMSSSSTSSSVGATVTFGKTLFPNEDTIIVIRRWGFSILRHLDDVEILLWNNIPPSIGRLQSSYSSSNISSKTNTKNIIDITTDCRKILGILQKQPKWCEWESCLFDCRKFDPTANPLLLVEQVIEQLDQINECWLPPPISSSVRFKSPFSTGSLSTAHLTAVSNLISLLDNCGIMEKSCQTLQSLFDMDSNNASSPSCEDIEITSQSWLNNNSNRSSGNRNSLTAGFRRQSLTAGSSGDHGGNSSSRFMEAVSNSCVEFLRQLCFNTTETRILFTFALLILIRRNELASNGLIKLHGKHRRERKNSHNDDDAGTQIL
uniref:Nucleoporin Nup120/160 beta-propeller domain-containing protein n=1 Tax=Trichobilharzia regenti TaxID=157069 RepID=A0AA85K6B6_TRIRE|nr:unnamed protein product [Trichobilharzia regenti]